MKSERAFGSIPIPIRSSKPRSKGLTMIFDFGTPLIYQEDILQASGDYIDMAKVVTGLSAIMPKEYLKRKIKLYRKYEVDIWPGGMFLEIALTQDKAEQYFKDAKEVGFNAIEISDNEVTIPMEEKIRLIEVAAKDYGFKVIGEVGRKEFGATSPRAMITDIKKCLDAGAWKVCIEALEIFSEKLETSLIDEVTSAIPHENLLFEMPGLMFHGVHQFDVMEIKSWLINKFGPEVNIANIYCEEVAALEAMRRGIHVGTFGKIGAYHIK